MGSSIANILLAMVTSIPMAMCRTLHPWVGAKYNFIDMDILEQRHTLHMQPAQNPCTKPKENNINLIQSILLYHFPVILSAAAAWCTLGWLGWLIDHYIIFDQLLPAC